MFKICFKDLKLFFSDKKGVTISFILPIALISLFAFAFGGLSGNNNGLSPITLPVCNSDNSSEAEKIISKLDSIAELDIERCSFDTAYQLVAEGKRIACLIFHEGFADSLNNMGVLPLELLYDEAKQIETGLLQSILINKIIQDIGTKKIENKIKANIKKQFANIPDKELNTIMHNIKKQFDSGNNNDYYNMPLKTTSIAGEKNNNNLGLIQAVAGVAVLMLLFSVAGIGSGLIEEKESGTLKKLFYSPINKTNILYGKMLAGFVISVIQLSIMFTFAWVAFGLDIYKDLPSLVLMIISTAFACSSFGIFLASIAKTRRQVQSLSMIIILVMSAIGGSMVPLFIMPALMQKIAVVSINYWSIQGFYDIFWRELPINLILHKILILLSIGVFVSIFSVILFKRNIHKLS